MSTHICEWCSHARPVRSEERRPSKKLGKEPTIYRCQRYPIQPLMLPTDTCSEWKDFLK